MIRFGKDDSFNSDPHKVPCSEQFQPKISIMDIFNNPEVKDTIDTWNKQKGLAKDFKLANVDVSRIRRHHPAFISIQEQERKRRMDKACKDVSRFDVLISNEWKKRMPYGTVPELITQHIQRQRQLIERKIPGISQEYFFRDFNDFIMACRTMENELNDTEGDILSDSYTEYTFTPYTVMTDYCGNFGQVDDKEKILNLINQKGTTGGLLCDYVGANGGRLVNYFAIVYKNTICKYRGYPQLALMEPDEKSESYIRYTFLLEE